ncbi:MAG: ATP-binding cassette domain-containing protein [Prevotellaceae bacterium]|jgi:ATPase subunit of ABC transporter with duplicated ATPase domains|nr:ATP-binding cassette domain-containing protein [Prevotellaceae bacterium]
MSIIINDLSYVHPDKQLLFNNITFSVSDTESCSVIGDNGIGKSMLLKIIAGKLEAATGSVACSSQPYYIPQHIGLLGQTIAEALQIADKLKSLRAIANGSIEAKAYETLGDDWDIESRTIKALEHWSFPNLNLGTSMDNLSGGERTKVFLAGLLIHQPDIILLDEPTNHLDHTSRMLLYKFIEQSSSSIIIVSHDINLLNRIDTTYEMRNNGVKLYSGNYSFYEEQKAIEIGALKQGIDAEYRAMRLAKKKAQEVKERQEKRNSQGEKNKDQLPRSLRKKAKNSGENTASRLKDKHSKIVEDHKNTLTELKLKRGNTNELKIDFDDANLRSGKQLVVAEQIRYSYPNSKPLWDEPMDIEVLSGDRIHIKGNNGSGKTTLLKLLLGHLQPTEGSIKRAEFSYVYLDQSYQETDADYTVLQMAERYNTQHLADHELKLRLNRFLFPIDTWDKSCKMLSGGERMRLYLCCLMISNHTPDLFILDEPTNNLDISSLKILTSNIKVYEGTVLVISHDLHFVNEIGIDKEIALI